MAVFLYRSLLLKLLWHILLVTLAFYLEAAELRTYIYILSYKQTLFLDLLVLALRGGVTISVKPPLIVV